MRSRDFEDSETMLDEVALGQFGRDPAAILAQGEAAGRFILDRPLGEGGMGTVYAAHDPTLNRSVAIKILHSGPNAAAKSRLVREAQALAKMHHPNVVSIYDAGSREDQVFIAMELVEGKTLRAWLDERRAAQPVIPWREVVALMQKAGRGLAAAHEHNLVHRDFKPENVLISNRGEVKVADFGLVVSVVGEAQDVKALSESAKFNTHGRLTVDGAVLGTPSYMAPEQFNGGEVDARADQFAFSVVMYEALYGTLPFRGENFFDLALRVKNGELEAPTEKVAVPNWLRTVVLRGLSSQAADRFPSMAALLNQLSRDRQRKWLWLGASTMAMLAAGGILIGAQNHRSAPGLACQDADARLATAWGSETRSRAQMAIANTQASYADAVWSSVQSDLDDYGARWVSMRTEACQATRIHGTQSTELLDLRMTCFETRLDELRALTERLGEANHEVVVHAADAVANLVPLDRCSGAALIAAAGAATIPAEMQQRAVALRSQLGKARATGLLGMASEGRAAAQKVYEESDALGLCGLAAEASLVMGKLELQLGKLDDAVESQIAALAQAEECHDSQAKFDAYTELIFVVGWELAQTKEGRQWARLAEALHSQMEPDLVNQAKLDQAIATLEGRAANYEVAVQRMRDSLDEFTTLGRPLASSRSLIGLGNLAMRQGQSEQALAYHQKALALREEVLGEDHPDLSEIHNNLGFVYASNEDYPAAREELQKALQIAERGYGNDHPRVADALSNLGAVEFAEGKVDKALAYFRRALEIVEKVQGHDHPDVALILTNIGSVLLERGETGEALVVLERATATCVASNAEPARTAGVRFALARALDDSKTDPGRARQLAKEALAVFEQLPHFSAEAGEVRAWLGESE